MKMVDTPQVPQEPAHQTEATEITDLQIATITGASAEGCMLLGQLAYETGVAATLYTSKGSNSPEYAGQIAKMREVTAQLKRILGPVLSL